MVSKHVLVTGASGQLGSIVIRRLLEAGHRVSVVVHKKNVPNDLLDKITAVLRLNLEMESQTEEAIAGFVKKYPDVEAALLLAGGYSGGDIERTGVDQVRQLMDLNFFSAYTVVRTLLPLFQKNDKGQFIMIGSKPALDPKAGLHAVSYAFSKTLLFTLSDLVNAQGKGTAVHSTVLVPSIMDTPPNREAMPKADFSKWVSTDQIAGTILYLLSPEGEAVRDTVLKLYHNA